MSQAAVSDIDSGDKAHVLVVDDEPLVLEGLRLSVYKEFVADLAETPDQGLEKLRKNGPYAVVVSDMRMPGMDGAEFLATVRAIAPDSVRMLLTGYNDLESAMRAVNEGRIFRFLSKPATPEQVLVALRACVAQYHASRSEKQQQEMTVKGTDFQLQGKNCSGAFVFLIQG